MAITTTADSATISTTPYYLGADSTSKSLQTIARRVGVTIDWTNVAEGDRFVAKLVRVINGNERTKIIGYAQGPSVPPLDFCFDGISDGWDVTVTSEGTGTATERSIAWAFTYEAVDLAALFTTALTESYATDGAAPTAAQALFAIQQWQQERVVSGTTLTVKKLDGSTTAMTFTLNDSSAPTSITRSG